MEKYFLENGKNIEKHKCKVISFKHKKDEITKKECEHLKVIVDIDEYYLKCGDCGVMLNPIQYIYKLATKESVLEWRIHKLQEYEKKIRNRIRTKCDHCGRMTSI